MQLLRCQYNEPSPAPAVSVKTYLNDLDHYQRKIRKRDPNNRVNIPYYRRVIKPFSSIH